MIATCKCCRSKIARGIVVLPYAILRKCVFVLTESFCAVLPHNLDLWVPTPAATVPWDDRNMSGKPASIGSSGSDTPRGYTNGRFSPMVGPLASPIRKDHNPDSQTRSWISSSLDCRWCSGQCTVHDYPYKCHFLGPTCFPTVSRV
jgi:hypothetical protein